MQKQIQAIQAEFIKVKHSKIIWVTFVGFGLAPIMGAVFIVILQDSEALERASALAAKAKAMNFEANWKSYFDILTQAVGVGGVLVFGFVASWIFGREYSDGTAKDLLSLPTSRTWILNAKFILYFIWCFILVVSNVLIASLLGSLLQLTSFHSDWLMQSVMEYFFTAILTIVVGIPIAFFALYGKGYLAPLGFVALTLVFSQVIAAAGFGTYFPWSIPGLYSGAGGAYKDALDLVSYLILFLTGVVGYFTTILYWNVVDHTK